MLQRVLLALYLCLSFSVRRALGTQQRHLELARHRLNRSLFPRLSLVNLVIGVIAMLTAAILQAAPVGIVEFEQSLRPVLAAGALIGHWLVGTAFWPAAAHTAKG